MACRVPAAAETLHLWSRLSSARALFLVSKFVLLSAFVLDTVIVSACIQFGLALPMASYFHRLSVTGLVRQHHRSSAAFAGNPVRLRLHPYRLVPARLADRALPEMVGSSGRLARGNRAVLAFGRPSALALRRFRGFAGIADSGDPKETRARRTRAGLLTFAVRDSLLAAMAAQTWFLTTWK